MYTVDDITQMLSKNEFNIKTEKGLKRVTGYTCDIVCEYKGQKADGIAIGVHKGDKGFWSVTDLHSGLAVTHTQTHMKRKDAIGAFLMKYPAYSRLCIRRALTGTEW